MELTIDQAFAAAYLLIADKHIRKYGRPSSSLEDDLEFVLTAMELGSPRVTMDPAFWHDWVGSVHKIVGEVTVDEVRLSEREPWLSALRFLERFYDEGKGHDVGVGELIDEMRAADADENPPLWEKWLASVDRASRQPAREITRMSNEWL